MKRLMMIAGPNGAGKTTTAVSLISQQKDMYEEFLNADEIARGLSRLNPESMNFEAGKLMIKRFRECLSAGKNFMFETTASGLSYEQHLKKAKNDGYEISLMFLWLPSPEQAIERVAQRVKQGGHTIPEDIIRRRYHRGLKNLLDCYLSLADMAVIVDSTLAESNMGKIIAKKEIDIPLQIEDKEIWEQIQKAAHV